MSRLVLVTSAIVLSALSITACGASGTAEDGTAKGHASNEGTTREATSTTLTACDTTGPSVLEQDAWSYAKDENISVDEARRRQHLQHCFSPDLADLERGLRNEETGTFAGLWIKNHPEYSFVVLFTRDGEQAIRPYLEGEPEQFRRLIEVRSGAEATLVELHAAGDRASRLVDESNVRAEGISTNVKKNRAEIFVTDKTRFEAALRKAGVRLPEHVAVVEIEGTMGPA